MKFPLRSVAVFAAIFVSSFLVSRAIAAPISQASPGVSSKAPGSGPPDQFQDTVAIPGPLRSFLRMAGISQEVTPNEVLPMLARNVFLHGFENGKETEFLILIDRYVHLARELQQLTGKDGKIQVSGCGDAAQLVHVLGYKFQHGCSRTNASLSTEDAERAFLTVDSGFPLTELEESLETGKTFTYAFPATPVPVLFHQNDWIGISTWRQKSGGDLLDVLLHDQQVGRLYSAMTRIDVDTAAELHRSPGLGRLLPFAASFDFYGSQICIQNNTVLVPGGPDAEKIWASLTGASPHSPAEFVLRLFARDRGWLAAYFDVLSRVSPEQQVHLVKEPRLKGIYEAYRASGLNVSAATGVFPRNAELLLLLSSIHWQPDNDQPVIPGDLKVWQEVFSRQAHTYGYKEWVKRVHGIQTPERFLDAVAAATNIVTENGPAQMYMMVSAIANRRPSGDPLSNETVQLLTSRFNEYQNWYLIFADFPQLRDESIAQFIKTADRMNGISAPTLRANALGAFQADIGIWQILARQKQIPETAISSSWNDALGPFGKVSSSTDLFDAARTSLSSIVVAAGGHPNPSQDEIVDLLAGPNQQTADGTRVHDELASRMRAVLNDQRLASLDTLFGLYDGLEEAAKGKVTGDSLLPMAEDLHEFEMPRPIFTGGERLAWSPLIYTSRHAELQVQTDLTKVLRSSRSPEQLEATRGRLTPFLRDTLVGLNYAYYEPPGAQVLHNNPLFVRSHDFSVSSVQGIEQVWGAPELIGIGATAGGGAYLMGSLADLPYALASAEEDFIAPEKVQALIWRETVPQLLVGAVVPRWWDVSRDELHAAALYQRAGEELLMTAQTDSQVREKVINILRDRLSTERLERLEESLERPQGKKDLLGTLLPSDTFYLAAHFRKSFPDEAAKYGQACRDLDELARKDPADTTPQRLSNDFGVPHPRLSKTDDPSLLAREPFPVSGGYSSRLFGESWESSNLYWARLADEMGYPPVMLNVLVPELTHHMVANIFATYVDDWPALLRAMQQTGDEFRQGKFNIQSASDENENGEVVNRSASE